MHLRQDIALSHAVARAVAALGHSSDLTPENAARIDAAVKTWALPRLATAYRPERHQADESAQN